MQDAKLEAHIRGQRISRRELVSESQDAMKACGADRRLRAEFLSKLAGVVRGDANPLLFQLRPEIRAAPNERLWSEAYQIVCQFLKDGELELTLDAAKSECPQADSLGPPLTEAQARIGFNKALHPPEPLSSSGASTVSASSRSPSKDESPRRRQRKRPRKVHEKVESTDSELMLDD
jgi:hypothetical protein